MKKSLFIILILVMLLCACEKGGTEEKTDISPNNEIQETNETENVSDAEAEETEKSPYDEFIELYNECKLKHITESSDGISLPLPEKYIDSFSAGHQNASSVELIESYRAGDSEKIKEICGEKNPSWTEKPFNNAYITADDGSPATQYFILRYLFVPTATEDEIKESVSDLFERIKNFDGGYSITEVTETYIEFRDGLFKYRIELSDYVTLKNRNGNIGKTKQPAVYVMRTLINQDYYNDFDISNFVFALN